MSSIFVALSLLVTAAQARPVIVSTFNEPDICYAGESFEAWVEVESDLDVAFSWEASDSLWDLGGSIDVYDEDGVFITCPSCPPATDGDSFTLTVWVSDSDGQDMAEWDVAITCSEYGGSTTTACSTTPLEGGLLIALMGLLRRRRAASVQGRTRV